jgi:hypothetical protein
LDPNINTFSEPQFIVGAFNQTYTNDSQSVFTTYFANNDSFISNGTYFSPVLLLNHAVPVSVSQVNWSWYEGAGLWANGSDIPFLDVLFQNDSKDISRYNNSYGIPGGNSPYQNFTSNCARGYCANFTGTGANSGYYYYNYTTPVQGQDFYVTAWINSAMRSIPGSSDSQVIEGYNSNWYLDFHSPDGTGQANNTVCNAQGNQVNVTAPADGTWNQYGCGYNGSGVQLFINGQLENYTPQPTANRTGDTTIDIGGSTAYNHYFNGFVEQVEYFNRSFTASEALQLFDWENLSGSNPWVHNFTNVSIAVRAKNYTFNDSQLVGWWNLGSSSDNETITNKSLDLSGNNNAMMFYGNVSVNTTGCVIGNCLNLTKGNLTSTSIAVSSTYTYAVWLNLGAAPSSIKALFSSDSAHNLSINSSGYLVWNDSGSSISTTAGISSGKWNDVVFFGNSTTIGISINGVLNNTVSVPGAASSGNLIVWPYNGLYGDLKVWNRTLSTSEISALYNSGCPICVGGEESNWSSWSSSYFGGNASLTGVNGNLAQYKSIFASTNTNYSAFLQNVTLNYSTPIVPPLISTTIPQPMTVYGYFTGSSPNSIVNVTAYMDGVQKGVFNVSTTGQYGLFDVQGNYTDFGQTLTLEANNSLSWIGTTVYDPGNTTEINISS